MTSIEYLKELIEFVGENWKQVLDGYFKDDNIDYDDRVIEIIHNFLEAYKEEKIADKASILQKVEKTIANDLLYKNIQECVDDILEPYYASAPFRALEAKDQEVALRAIEEIFGRAILRLDPKITQDYEKYGFCNRAVFMDFLNALDALCTFVVGKNFCYDAIYNFIYLKTRLPQGVCRRVTDLVEDNLTQLKINYIIEKLNG